VLLGYLLLAGVVKLLKMLAVLLPLIEHSYAGITPVKASTLNAVVVMSLRLVFAVSVFVWMVRYV
jgi:hypothetical protein